MKIKLIFLLGLLLLITFSAINAQVTLGKIETKKDTIALKPLPYDSSKNFEKQSQLIDYKQYIGLKVYLPPLLEHGGRPSLFTKSPNIISINKPSTGSMNDDYTGKNKIMTFIYKPLNYVIDQGINGRQKQCVISDSAKVGDKYYTIIDALYGEIPNKIWHEMYSILWDKRNTPDVYVNVHIGPDGLNGGYPPELIFVLRNDIDGDTAYWFNTNFYENYGYQRHFVLVPYFVKQKQLYDGKTFVAINPDNQTAIDESTNTEINVKSLSKWKCEVMLLKNKNGEYNPDLSYIFKNNNNQTIVLNTLETDESSEFGLHFVLEDVYLAQEKEKQMQKVQLEAKRKKEYQEKIQKENYEKQQHLQYCIDKYGQSKGELIAQGNVTIGMTKEMCEIAWGKPWDIKKVTDNNGTLEYWHYGWDKSLHFENGVLVRFEE